MIRVSSLPISQDKDAVLATLADDVSAASGLDKTLITYYWQTFDAINCMGEKTLDRPIYVDINVPCFMTNDEIVVIMHAIADSLVKTTGIEKKWVFINTLRAESGLVLLSGEVQYCDDDTPGGRPIAPGAK